jgi:hypothetical protein
MRFFYHKAPMPHPLLVLLFDFLQFFNCLILVFAMHITVSPTQRAPVLDVVPSHFTAPSAPPSRLVDSDILPQRLYIHPQIAPGKGQRLRDAREANHSPRHQANDLQCSEPTHDP